jgi:hypothetical protein
MGKKSWLVKGPGLGKVHYWLGYYAWIFLGQTEEIMNSLRVLYDHLKFELFISECIGYCGRNIVLAVMKRLEHHYADVEMDTTKKLRNCLSRISCLLMT